MTPEQTSAVVTLVQLVSLIPEGRLWSLLDEMDLDDEAFEEDLQIVKKMVDWNDEEDGQLPSDEDEDEDEDE